MLRLISLVWGKFFLWVTQPAAIGLIITSITLFAVTFYFFDVPAIGLALKGFVLYTLPKWYGIAVKFILKFSIKTGIKNAFKMTVSLFAFRKVIHYFELKLQHLKSLLDGGLKKWKTLSIKAKTGWITLSFCFLWLPFGSWIILFVPLVVIKDILTRLFRFLLTKLGLEVAFRKLVNFLGRVLIPRWAQAHWHWHISRKVYAKRRVVRKRIENSQLGQRITKYADKNHTSLKEKLEQTLVPNEEERV